MSQTEGPGSGDSVQSVTCREATGLDCDYVAELDPSVDVAERGVAVDQLLAQLTTHVSRDHEDEAISPDQISKLRDRLTSGG